GPAEEVYFKPLHPYTQLLVGSNPQPDPRLERGRPTLPIAGEIVSPIDVGPGCPFASRCPKVMSVCRSKTPQLHAVPGAGDSAAAAERQRRVACHLFPPAAVRPES
ncbi:MAG TPA: oligopeptide/dipeptide ABC transporter ATP-binding protein, partial [Gammaproteobacteria bacterium]|nr:oligopeptide/dipeptide ABC transporter ATP-binding protein [Gammaproteobacteria bacterium]